MLLMKTNSIKQNDLPSKTTRRSFLKRSAAATATVSIVPGHVLGVHGQTPPSGKLNIAAVGIGGMGRNNIAKLAENENIVALCDVDGEDLACAP